MLLTIVLLVAIALTWARTLRPGLNRVEGTVILVSRVPLLARIRMHALPAVLTIGLTTALALLGRTPWWLAAVAASSAIVLMAIPVSYTITDLGIRLGQSSFRRWTEFAAVRRSPGGARLIGATKARGMQIWLSGSRGDDEFLQFLRQTLKGAYKGTSRSMASASNGARPVPEPEAGGEHLSVVSVQS